jgi:hypothetical protein
MNSGLLLIYSQTNTTKGWTQVYYSYIVKQTQPEDELRFTTRMATCVRPAQVTPIYLLIGRSGNPDLTLG